MPPLVIAACTPQTRYIQNVATQTIAFMGSSGSTFGIGLIDVESGDGPTFGVLPARLIQAWRAMHILDHLRTFTSELLAGCWYAAARELRECDNRDLRELIKLLGRDQLNAIRDAVLAMQFPGDELDHMLVIVSANGIRLDCSELAREVELGSLPETETVRALIATWRQQQAKADAIEAEIARPVPDDESVGVLLRDLRITNLIDHPINGQYGTDWRHVDPDEIDALAKAENLWHDHGFELWRTTRGPGNRTFGNCEPVIVVNRRGDRFTLTTVFYQDGVFLIEVSITMDGTPFRQHYTPSQLRGVIGKLPRRKLSDLLG